MKKLTTLLAIAALTLGSLTSAHAGARRFAFTYETTTTPKGNWELENSIIWGHGSTGDGFEFGHELEYGLTDNLQVAIILSEWNIEHVKGEGSKATWDSAGAELMWAVSNPVTDPVGVALLGETRIGPEVFALEGRVVLQKNFGSWVAAYNAVLEATWEGSNYDAKAGALTQTLGLSYQVNPSVMVGVEAFDEVTFDDWSDASPHALYVGPSFGYRKGNLWTAIAPVFRVTDAAGEPNFKLRAVIGINF